MDRDMMFRHSTGAEAAILAYPGPSWAVAAPKTDKVILHIVDEQRRALPLKYLKFTLLVGIISSAVGSAAKTVVFLEW